MKFDITAIYKSKERIKDSFIRRKYKQVEIDMIVDYNDVTDGYYISKTSKIIPQLREIFNMKESNITFNVPMDYLGDNVRDLNFVVEILVPNPIIRKLKINKVLGISLLNQ
jgi:hypothetical protein